MLTHTHPAALPGQDPDELTVVVFKDNFAARTFRVPLRWISRLGTLVAVLALLAALSTLLAAKYYRMARRGSPSRVNELEDELGNLRSSYSSLQAKALEDAKKLAAMPPPAAPIAGAPAPKVEVAPLPPPPPPVAAAPAVARPPGMTALLFQDLPGNVTAASGEAPVKLAPPKLHWHAGTLEVQTALEYSRTDGGNQQGHIVILARGPASLFAYPDSVLNTGTAPTLLSPEHGESFSVSRYREIRAEFAPIEKGHPVPQELEILIFGDGGENADAPVPLLIHERVPIPPPPAEPAPRATRRAPRPAPAPAPTQTQAPESGAGAGAQTSPPAGAGAQTTTPGAGPGENSAGTPPAANGAAPAPWPAPPPAAAPPPAPTAPTEVTPPGGSSP